MFSPDGSLLNIMIKYPYFPSPGVRVVVDEDSDAVLPCSPRTKEDITGKLFDWKKDGQKEKKEVFLYVSGLHYNNGRTGQDKQFKGRVSHFQDQLMNGNASIKIQNVKMADSGIYRCIFPHHSQTFNIELVVGEYFHSTTTAQCHSPHNVDIMNLLLTSAKLILYAAVFIYMLSLCSSSLFYMLPAAGLW
uniref:Ig-like domain-containing protein n=1 Tax=Sparus aurata TaxID=8175 RepID=A0A671X2M4_SPAAU